jgi:hypothetical protein
MYLIIEFLESQHQRKLGKNKGTDAPQDGGDTGVFVHARIGAGEALSIYAFIIKMVFHPISLK